MNKTQDTINHIYKSSLELDVLMYSRWFADVKARGGGSFTMSKMENFLSLKAPLLNSRLASLFLLFVNISAAELLTKPV